MGGISYENDQFLIDVEGYYKTLTGLTQYAIRQSGFTPGTAGTIEQDFFQGTGRAKVWRYCCRRNWAGTRAG